MVKSKISNKVIEFFRHNIDDECLAEFGATARNIFITTGPKTTEFEASFAEYLGLPHAVGTMSCTHSLHLAYRALGIGRGDEVIVPAFTFIATVTAVIHAGGTPVLADVDPKTGILDPDAAIAAITPKTKAICPVHLYGVMAPMERFAEIARKHRLKLVEDCAHCIEGKGPGFGPGSLSDAAAFSFYATKNITCGEGGALATRHEDLAEQVKSLRNHGMTANAAERFGSSLGGYDVQEVGYKCNMTDLQASLLIPQLRRIEERHKRRREIFDRYQEGLKDADGIILPHVPEGYKSAFHLYAIRVSKPQARDTFLKRLKEMGIGCSVHYRPLTRLALFREELRINTEDFPVATKLGDATLTLPFYPALTNEEVDTVINAVRTLGNELLT